MNQSTPARTSRAYQIVRIILGKLEAQFREIALLALADWERLDLPAPELFRSVAALQRPSWGHWNGLLSSLREARKRYLRIGTAAEHEKIEQATTLTTILEFLDKDIRPDQAESIAHMAAITKSPLPRKPKMVTALTMPITLRNLVSHFAPMEQSWWDQAAQALERLQDANFGASLQQTLSQDNRHAAPWFWSPDPAGGLCAFNGLRDDAVIYASPTGEPREAPAMLQPVLLAFQKLLGKTDQQEESLKRLLAKLAPEELKGVLLGDYLVGRPAGGGGYATVHVGTQLSTGRKVAVKILRDGMSEDARARFHQEAVFLSRLNHPHIVNVIGHGEEAWFRPREPDLARSLAAEAWFEDLSRQAPVKSYIAMEWIDGPTLEDVFQRRHQPEPDMRQLATLFLQASQALAAVHGAGLIHRDVKPSNLMISEQGELQLMDFGIARTQDEIRTVVTTPDRPIGTPAYMSPEQRGARDVDAEVGPATDIYSLCGTFYELFTHKRLHGHDRETLKSRQTQRQVDERPEEPRSIVKHLPWELNTILLGGLEPGVAERYRSMADLERDLRHYLSDEPIEYRRPSRWRRFQLWYRRNTWVANLIAVAALLLLVTAVVATAAAVVTNGALTDKTQALKKERYTSYLRSVSLADRELLANRGERAEQLLNECSEDLRSLEWHYLKHKCHLELRRLPGHTGPVQFVMFSPDGKRLASAGADNTVRLWDVPSGKEVGVLRGHKDAVYALKFSPDGKRIASAGADKTVRLWDILNLDKEPLTFRRHTGVVKGVSFGIDGNRLASFGQDHTILLWDLTQPADQQPLSIKPAEPDPDHPKRTGQLMGVAFDPKAKRLAVALWWSEMVRGTITNWGEVSLWMVPDEGPPYKSRRVVVSQKVPILTFDFHPAGRWLAWGDLAGEIKVWDTNSQDVVLTLGSHPAWLNQVVFSPDGKSLASSGSDGLVKIWGVHWLDIVPWEANPDLAQMGKLWENVRNLLMANVNLILRVQGVRGAAFSPDHQLIATADDQNIKLWHGTSSAENNILSASRQWQNFSLALSPDGRLLAWDYLNYLGGRAWITVWDVEKGEVVHTLSGHSCVAFSHDGLYLAGASGELFGPGEFELTVWNLATGKPKVWNEQDGKEFSALRVDARLLTSVAFHPNGKQLAIGTGGSVLTDNLVGTGSAREPGDVRIWDLETGTLVRRLTGHKQAVASVAYSPDGRYLASASRDQTVKIWDAATGEEVRTLTLTSDVLVTVFSPDGQFLAAAGGEKTVTLWDVKTWEKRHSLQGHNAQVRSLAFSADCRRLISGAGDQGMNGTIKIWDVETGQELLTLLEPEGETTGLVCSTDNKRIFSSSRGGAVRVWGGNAPRD